MWRTGRLGRYLPYHLSSDLNVKPMNCAISHLFPHMRGLSSPNPQHPGEGDPETAASYPEHELCTNKNHLRNCQHDPLTPDYRRSSRKIRSIGPFPGNTASPAVMVCCEQRDDSCMGTCADATRSFCSYRPSTTAMAASQQSAHVVNQY
jgi:hypothetical protein